MNECSTRPLIYSCSGCSDVAQLANDTAVALDHAGEFEMSCISGVGGKVPTLVKKVQSGRPMLMIDSCQLHCAKSCLENVGVEIPEARHIKLYELGYKNALAKVMTMKPCSKFTNTF
ncbi:putative zinc-binding protein [Kingella negevensis]|uniref:DGC domain protein n=1 Tax=Kingella negevensis TaxID=1522312 RepID=A0A238HJR4_9NEIS|nr:putative zinc-binding protein [Kingella negevensis]MDK4685457.1 putative zinc-binding protein [Kingella negevensis]MDK4698297.1 putative zinc-binding protein [Kingella negevensis]MDK4707850.1 putative zinc-binding protein [Kingella negevensis]MDK4709374.1 putative zinc-binding protein [Kingella negevensis]SNB83397.1 DGC domain protein [Kingella negevensis]